MRTKVSFLFLLSSLIAVPVTYGSENELVKDKEIAYILDSLKKSDCLFIRNGDSYNGEKAADHLAGKYDYARDKIVSAESFIENIASASYFSGRAYQVDCPNEAKVNSEVWLKRVLAEFRQQ